MFAGEDLLSHQSENSELVALYNSAMMSLTVNNLRRLSLLEVIITGTAGLGWNLALAMDPSDKAA